MARRTVHLLLCCLLGLCLTGCEFVANVAIHWAVSDITSDGDERDIRQPPRSDETDAGSNLPLGTQPDKTQPAGGR